MSRRNIKVENQLLTINQELNENILSDKEVQLLAQKLPRYTANEPSLQETRLLIERLRPHMQHDSKRFSEILEQRQTSRLRGWARIKPYLLPQTQLLAWSFWLVSACIVILGTLLYVLIGDSLAQAFSTFQWHTHPLILLIPLLSGFSLIYSFRSYGTPMYELELSFPITPAQWLLSKLSIIVLYDIILGTAASFIIYSITPAVGEMPYHFLPFIVSWLVPLCLYCVGSVACMLRFGTLIGSLVMAAAWFVQLLMINQLGSFYFLSDPSYGQWQESKWIALLLTLIFASDVFVYLRKMKGTNAMLIK